MNKKQYIVILIIAALLLMGVDSVHAADTTTTTTATTTSGPKTAGEQGDDDGKAAGEADGAVAGAADRYNGKKSDYKSALPKDAEISDKYKLNLDAASYKSHFVSAYRKNFKEGYERAFRDTNLSLVNSEDGSDAGRTLGTAAGSLAAMNDYIMNKKNDANNALKRYTLEQSIASRFHLSKDSSDYAKVFVSGFETGFKEAYNAAYRARVVDFEVENSNTYEISMAGENVSRVWPVYDVSTGGASARENLECAIDIEAGTVYAPTYINVSGEQYSFNYKNYSYTPVSSVFNVKLWGAGKTVVLRKPMVMRFNVVGSEKAGIYRWSGYKWLYLPTVVDENGISTVIPAGEYNGGRYAIFIDENAKPYSDTAFNWAREEINAFKRRGYIDQTGTFNPDEKITRIELAKILYKMRYAEMGLGSTSLKPLDLPDNSEYYNIVRFVLAHGYMTLNKNKFWLDEGFRYDYVQYLTKNTIGVSVKWSDVAQRILQERFYRSAGIQDKNRYMTRAEAIYLLYHYFDK